MSDLDALEDLVGYLTRTSRLSPLEARHVVDEVLSFLAGPPRRFRALPSPGVAGGGLGERRDLHATGRGAAPGAIPRPPYSERQIRRLIYG